jgi:predicted aspartyl protease
MPNPRHLFTVALIALGFSVAPERSEAACTISTLAELAVTMTELRPLVAAKFNGSDALLVVDSGAFYSMLSPASASQLKLKSAPASALVNVRIEGIHGEIAPLLTTVKEFSIANVASMTLPNFRFLVVDGTDPGAGAVGLLGQNLLGFADVEYDLAHGAVRLVQPHDCDRSPLAYWVKATSSPYSVIEIDSGAKPHAVHTIGAALLNGKKIRVVFDTGAPVSMLTLAAARHAGVNPGSPGVVPAGTSSWMASFDSLKIDTEEMHNVRLRFSDFSMAEGDMLVGADFFLSHRVYVANSQNKLYFTYNGGAPFNLSSAPPLALEPGLRGFRMIQGPEIPYTMRSSGASDMGMPNGMMNQ